MKKLVCLLIMANYCLGISAQEIMTPLQDNNYLKLTSYDQLSQFVYALDKSSDILNTEAIGKSPQGRNLYVLKFSASEFGKDKTKIRLLLFAQQHGNEQSGKEGALLLACDLLKPENRYLFDRIDLAIVPQMNPDGSEADKRLNGNGMDLNRNHLILTEPETKALQNFFDRYLFEVTMDVHEYWPFGKSWKKAGYYVNTDELLGSVNNPNVAKDIMQLADESFLPFLKKYLNDRHFTCFAYCPGGPPEVDYIRHSTFDINDGRQSFGIRNTFSFIQEGLNGKDSSLQNIRHRAEGQLAGMKGLIEFSYMNRDKIKTMIYNDRENLIHRKSGDVVSIQCDHFKTGVTLQLPVHSYATDKDTLVNVSDYRPAVKSTYVVDRPDGYFIPKNLIALTEWADRHAFLTEKFKPGKSVRIEQYEIIKTDSIDFERDNVVNPETELKELKQPIAAEDYIYLPTDQQKGNMIVIALEPKSILGLATYKQFSWLLKPGEKYPVLRVYKK